MEALIPRQLEEAAGVGSADVSMPDELPTREHDESAVDYGEAEEMTPAPKRTKKSRVCS